MTPEDPGELEPLSGGVVDTPSVLGKLFPELDQNQTMAKKEETTGDVVNKTVRRKDDQQQSTKGDDLSYKTESNERQHPKTPKTVLYPQFSESTKDKICYNCGNQGHVSRTCPTRSRLCSEIDLSPGPSNQRPSLYHIRQEEYFGGGGR